ncbi:hypothetical protein WJX72_011596 [[Myrmecia] bisecta]|uniref:Cupin type-1 domain-containing protein n=1 Tax=[Myrmecia] bisecta TaxID=41462 RepID=A0AAW1PUQ7_9CHLO
MAPIALLFLALLCAVSAQNAPAPIAAPPIPPANTQEVEYLTEQTNREQFPGDALGNSLSQIAFSTPIGVQTGAGLPANPIFATLPNGGLYTNINALEPCALVLPHHHPRASEHFYILQD